MPGGAHSSFLLSDSHAAVCVIGSQVLVPCSTLETSSHHNLSTWRLEWISKFPQVPHGTAINGHWLGISNVDGDKPLSVMFCHRRPAPAGREIRKSMVYSPLECLVPKHRVIPIRGSMPRRCIVRYVPATVLYCMYNTSDSPSSPPTFHPF